ncbi:MAG TPA: hypothetical protein DCY88_00475 [Cyanobacteria bacterium UBA11372]|nr:hypothetical protein [Cyanobacteria bacterium UBA11372]
MFDLPLRLSKIVIYRSGSNLLPNSIAEKYRLIDLFSGAGGFTLGFTDERYGGGFQSILALDNDLAAIQG